ncbi:NifU family protein [Burkholderia sp. Ax-1719]|nr:NifU family protein [Burkholderia sp. Ax-1719]
MTDLKAVEGRAKLVTRMLGLHGGGIEVIGFNEASGVVKLSFTGLCTACSMRPMTLESIVRPAFLDLDGVKDVDIDGVRISRFASARLRDASTVPPAGHYPRIDIVQTQR